MSKRPIKSILLGDLLPNEISSEVPEILWVDPATLLVNEDYQRSLSDNSMRLIRKMVTGWDWRKFKPPVVSRAPEGLEVIDGQHTSIGAASHPAINLIPVLLVHAVDMADRARAFVSHNRDRLGITATQLHYSAVAAGEPEAVAVQQACDAAGVRILKMPPASGAFKPRDTMAVAAITKLVSQRGPEQAADVLKVLVEAEACPISADGVKAIDLLLHEPEYAESVVGANLTETIVSMGGGLLKEARVFAATHQLPIWRSLAVIIFRNTRKRRKG